MTIGRISLMKVNSLHAARMVIIRTEIHSIVRVEISAMSEVVSTEVETIRLANRPVVLIAMKTAATNPLKDPEDSLGKTETIGLKIETALITIVLTTALKSLHVVLTMMARHHRIVQDVISIRIPITLTGPEEVFKMTAEIPSTDLVVLFPAMETEAMTVSEETMVSEAMMQTEAVKALEATTESNVDLASPAAASMIRTVEIPSTVPIINLEARMQAINLTGPEEASIRMETNHSIAPDVHLIRLKVVTDHVSMADRKSVV